MISCRFFSCDAGLLGASLICAWFIILPTSDAHADPLRTKTEVQITFDMPDRRYTDEFTDEELQALRESAGRGIADVLGDSTSFLNFSTDRGANYGLTVSLDRAEGSQAAGPAEFGFHLALNGPEVDADAKGYVPFRTKDKFLTPIGDQLSLIAEIKLTMGRFDYRELVRRIFRHVAIAEQAKLHPQPLGWIVDRDRSFLCLDQFSRLEVVNSFPSTFGHLRTRFEAQVLDVQRPDGRIVSIADTNVRPDMIDQLTSTDPKQVSVEHVFVREYRRFCPPQIIPADQVDFPLTGADP